MAHSTPLHSAARQGTAQRAICNDLQPSSLHIVGKISMVKMKPLKIICEKVKYEFSDCISFIPIVFDLLIARLLLSILIKFKHY